MSKVLLAGEIELNLVSQLVAVGDNIADLKFTAEDLSEVTLEDFKGPLLLNFFPSVDTGICAMSVKKFTKEAASKITLLNISGDLPFATGRFCAAEGVENAVTLSTFRHQESLESLGLLIDTLPLRGLSARAVILVDENKVVKYVNLNNEIKTDPDFAAALLAVDDLLAA